MKGNIFAGSGDWDMLLFRLPETERNERKCKKDGGPASMGLMIITNTNNNYYSLFSKYYILEPLNPIT